MKKKKDELANELLSVYNNFLDVENRYCVVRLGSRTFGGFIANESKDFFHIKTFTDDGRDYYYCLAKDTLKQRDTNGIKFYAKEVQE